MARKIVFEEELEKLEQRIKRYHSIRLFRDYVKEIFPKFNGKKVSVKMAQALEAKGLSVEYNKDSATYNGKEIEYEFSITWKDDTSYNRACLSVEFRLKPDELFDWNKFYAVFKNNWVENGKLADILDKEVDDIETLKTRVELHNLTVDHIAQIEKLTGFSL